MPISFIHIPKTGGVAHHVYIRECLRGYCSVVPSHCDPKHVPSTKFVALVRNPLAFYVSFFNHECKLAAMNHPNCTNVYFNMKHPDKKFVYDDGGNFANFRIWLKCVLDNDFFNMEEEYSLAIYNADTYVNNEETNQRLRNTVGVQNQALRQVYGKEYGENDIGLLTYILVLMCYERDFTILGEDVCHYKDVCLVRLENTKEEFIKFWEINGVPKPNLDKLEKAMSKVHHAHKHAPFMDYYDDETENLVRHKDRYIFSRFYS